MTSELLKFQTSLARRFQVASNPSIDQISSSLIRSADRSFALRYLLSFSKSQFECFEVFLTKATLEIANQDGRKAALRIIDRYSNEDENTFARSAVGDAVAKANIRNLPLYDKYLFELPNIKTKKRNIKRNCYKNILSSAGIRLPFDKKSMKKLFTSIDQTYESQPVKNFEDLREFIWQFVKRSWPLFDSSILYIPLSYFSFDQNICPDTMRAHLERMTEYGFERLLARLIILQAVTGGESAKEAVLRGYVAKYSQYNTSEILRISNFISGKNITISESELTSIGKGNPIEQTTYLIIYLKSSKTTYQFMNRIIFFYCKDPGALKLIDWDEFITTIEKTGDFLIPELVAMAAILSEDGILQEKSRIRKLYVPTSANTDLFNYSKYCREDLNLSPHRFFRSFSKLPTQAQICVFNYLLKPGIMDTIANVFPSPTNIGSHVPYTETTNALSLKLDCVSYLKKRNLIGNVALEEIEESTRQRLRQVKYEEDRREGRIRFSAQRMSSEIRQFIKTNYSPPMLEKSTNDDKENDLQEFLKNRFDRSFSTKLTKFICFENRFAFDYLVSNLRHNFLRFKLESAIDSAFCDVVEPTVTQFKTAMQGELNEFCADWLTLYETRSFFEGLRESLYKIFNSFDSSEVLDTKSLSLDISRISKGKFDRLLTECRRVWRTNVKTAIVAEVIERFEFSEYASDTNLKDLLVNQLEKSFDDAENWLTVNDTPITREIGLRELFIFESTNFSSATTRLKPLHVECHSKVNENSYQNVKDIVVSGGLFDAMVQLIQNLLENAFEYSGLSISDTSIFISIFDLNESKLKIHFRNNFNSKKRSEISNLVKKFNSMASIAQSEAGTVPLYTGGSGLRRIFFEFENLSDYNFELKASKNEFYKDIFLIECIITKTNTDLLL